MLSGDSIVLAADSEEDLGALIRESGVSAVNLGMGGYAPQHYADAYRRLILQKRIAHRNVLVFLFEGNDFHDAEEYERIGRYGVWADYLTRTAPQSQYQKGLPWFYSIAQQFSREVVQELAAIVRPYTTRPSPQGLPGTSPPAEPPVAVGAGDDTDRIELPTKEPVAVGAGDDTHRIELPTKEIEITEYLWWPPEVSSNHASWQLVFGALTSIIEGAHDASAQPVVLLVPSPATVYAEWYEPFTKHETFHRKLSQILGTWLQDRDVEYLDLTEPIRRALLQDFVYVSDGDTHFNLAGIKGVFDAVSRRN